MDIGSLIENHGYWVLALGCLLEGETVAVLAGYAAHRGYLHPGTAWAVAAGSAFVGDQCFFWLGRRHGAAMLARFPSLARQADRVHGWIDRQPALAVIGVRFAYGLRIAGPLLIGSSSMPAWRFAALNALGAMAWAGVLVSLGWAFGEAAQAVLGNLKHVEGWLLAALVLLGLGWWGWQRRKS